MREFDTFINQLASKVDELASRGWTRENAVKLIDVTLGYDLALQRANAESLRSMLDEIIASQADAEQVELPEPNEIIGAN